MALQHDDPSTLAEQASARTTAPAVSDQGTKHDHDHDHEDGHDHSHGFDWLEAARIAFAALAAVAVWFKLWEPFAAVSVIGIAGLVVGGLRKSPTSGASLPGGSNGRAPFPG